jgi:hypothetical protein
VPVPGQQAKAKAGLLLLRGLVAMGGAGAVVVAVTAIRHPLSSIASTRATSHKRCALCHMNMPLIPRNTGSSRGKERVKEMQ